MNFSRKIENIYLVDCENVGLKNIEGVPQGSLVVYFTSNNQRMQKLVDNETVTEREYHCEIVYNPNAMDFVITTSLGWFVATYGKSVKYTIVSKDHGFDYAVCVWVADGYDVERLYLVEGKLLKEPIVVPSSMENPKVTVPTRNNASEKESASMVVQKEPYDMTKREATARMGKIKSLLSTKSINALLAFSKIFKNSTSEKGKRRREEALRNNIKSHKRLKRELEREGEKDTLDFVVWYIKKY